MKKAFHIFLLLLLLLSGSRAQAQTFTFECICDYVTAADSNCDVCNSTVQSRLFCGLLVRKNGVGFKWIDQPYIIKFQGQNATIQEIIPAAEVITIARTGTAYGTLDSFKMAIDCPCNTFKEPIFWITDSTQAGPVYLGDTVTVVGHGLAEVSFDSLLKKIVVNVDSITGFGTGTVISIGYIAPSAGFTITGTNPVTINGTWTFALSDDLAALEALSGTGIPARTGTNTWALRTITAGAGISVADGSGAGGNPTITNTGVLVEVDGSTTNEAWTIDADDADTELITTQTVKFQGGGILVTDYIPGTDILSMVATEVDGSNTNEIQALSVAANVVTLSLGGGSITFAGAGINVVTTAGSTVTITGTEAFLGTVTNLTAGNLSPLFTTVVNTPGSTPDIVFSLTNAGSNTYFGNATGSTGAPSYTADAALTKVDDTNVTLTLGGSPTTSLLHAASLTLGWTGILAVSRGGIGVGTITGIMQGNGTSAVTGITNSSTVGQVLRVTGASTYAWGALDLANSSAVTGDLPSANIVQGIAHSVWGVAGNALADHADIQSSAADQVLVANSGNTGVSFATVNTAGITAAAVTNAKLANMAAHTFKANNTGISAVPLDITATQATAELDLFTSALKGLVPLSGGGTVNFLRADGGWQPPPGAGVQQSGVLVNNRITISAGSNLVKDDGAFVVDPANDIMTIFCTTPAQGVGVAILNLQNVGTDVSGDFLRMDGNMSATMTAGMYNVNTATGATIFTVGTGGDAAGDPIYQWLIAGGSGGYVSAGMDNSDVNKWKLTNTAAPGATPNDGLTMTRDAIARFGINNDAPAYAFDVIGRTKSSLGFIGKFAQWVAGNFLFGTGAGTGPVLNSFDGTDNGLHVSFTTGTAPTANGIIFTATYPNSWANVAFVTFSADQVDISATDFAKFKTSGRTGVKFDLKAVGTLAASTNYQLCFSIFGM